MPRIPMLAIVGKKKHGKTTITVQLAAELKRRGHRVMTIKHGTHTFNLDPEGTDTYRHYHEGEAEKVVMVAPDKFALVARWSVELPPEEIAERYLADADIVLCEGFKASALPRVEVFRRVVGDRPLYEPGSPHAPHYLAMLTDDDAFAVPGVRMIRFSSAGWLAELAELAERDVMRRS
jgi:molybdopterin-guanine dinucleotide biosynthesis protein MobB